MMDKQLLKFRAISIHSLRMEGDAVGWLAEEMLQDFNPLPPHGGRLDFIDTVHHS